MAVVIRLCSAPGSPAVPLEPTHKLLHHLSVCVRVFLTLSRCEFTSQGAIKLQPLSNATEHYIVYLAQLLTLTQSDIN